MTEKLLPTTTSCKQSHSGKIRQILCTITEKQVFFSEYVRFSGITSLTLEMFSIRILILVLYRIQRQIQLNLISTKELRNNWLCRCTNLNLTLPPSFEGKAPAALTKTSRIVITAQSRRHISIHTQSKYVHSSVANVSLSTITAQIVLDLRC